MSCTALGEVEASSKPEQGNPEHAVYDSALASTSDSEYVLVGHCYGFYDNFR